jgi:hypothetical protein
MSVRSEPIPFAIGDVIRLKKPHPCGGTDWRVDRLGADLGLKCLGCGRRVLLPRREVERRLKLFVSRATSETAPLPAREDDDAAPDTEPLP